MMQKDQSKNAKVKPAPPPSDNNNSDNTVRVVFEVKLRPVDQKLPYRVTMANEVVQRMSETIHRGKFFPPTKGDITLEINIVACSEGDRCGRLCCAELGVGWVMLDCDWLLMEGDAKLTEPKKEKLRKTGALGFADCWYDNYGQYTLFYELCYKMVERIGTKSAKALLKL
jgi:hypothetical protein